MAVGLAEELKAIQRTARDALRAVRDFENEEGGDVFGRFVVQDDEEIDSTTLDELAEFLRLAKQQYPQHELSLIVVAKVE